MSDFIKGELIDIIEWIESSPETMVWRFVRPDNAIKNGAQLIVRPGQQAVFVDQGNIADVFLPGQHELATKNLPVLSRLRGWKYGFSSPFKADVVFVSTRQFAGARWGTKAPVMTTDPELGPVRLRAFGTYTVRVSNAETVVREMVGSNASLGISQISDQLRDLIVARFSETLGEQSTSVLKLAAHYEELGAATAQRLVPDVAVQCFVSPFPRQQHRDPRLCIERQRKNVAVIPMDQRLIIKPRRVAHEQARERTLQRYSVVKKNAA